MVKLYSGREVDLTANAHRRVFWPKVVLIGSLRFYEEMQRLYEQFEKEEIDAKVPWPFLKMEEDPRQFDEFWTQNQHSLSVANKFSVEAHLARIASSDLAYVVNPGGYVGVNSATDIGYAIGRRTPVYAIEPISDMGVHVVIDGVKTPEEIIIIGKEIYKSKYRPLRQHFIRQLKKH